ncbi:MAG: hydrogenase iron-sulfur subunit [Thermodesulfobacteriota bacterium]|nr:hydrogenase iron-sulfur subunit [Thermodesulfobacteriota bacterium]
MSDTFKPEIIAFCCHYTIYNFARDLQGLTKSGFPENVKIEKVSCSGRVARVHLLRTLEEGADGVYVVGCEEEKCHNGAGSRRAKKRSEYVKDVLLQLGMEPERTEMFFMPRGDEAKFIDIAREMVEKIKALGPSPLRGK